MAFVEGSNDGVLNSTTAVTIVAAPAASTRRIVRSIVVQNKDTASVTLTLLYDNNATQRQICKVALAANDTLSVDDVFVLDATTKTIKAKLAGAVAANQPEFVATYGDAS